MIRSTDITPDTYKGGAYLRRWSLVDGWPRCVEDAYDVSATDVATLNAQAAANAAIRDQLAALEAYECAMALAGQPEPVKYLDVTQEDGTSVKALNAAWTEWDAAVQAVAAVSADILALHQQRQAVAA